MFSSSTLNTVPPTNDHQFDPPTLFPKPQHQKSNHIPKTPNPEAKTLHSGGGGAARGAGDVARGRPGRLAQMEAGASSTVTEVNRGSTFTLMRSTLDVCLDTAILGMRCWVWGVTSLADGLGGSLKWKLVCSFGFRVSGFRFRVPVSVMM